ncbi:hypothetical protein ACTXT7_003852 [Hymenolepis weldensis]
MARKVQISLEKFKEISTCDVCFSTVKDPWTLPCGNFLCYDPCLTGLIKNKDDQESDKAVKEIMGETWETRKAPSPLPLDYEIDRPPPSAESYEAERLAFLIANDPTFVSVSQRPPKERGYPRWPVCDDRNCPHIHPNRLCMDLLCPGGEVCDLVHRYFHKALRK